MCRISALLTIFACLVSHLLPAQPELMDTVLLGNIMASVEARLEKPGGDTAQHFIFAKVRNHCGTDDNCQYKAYHDIMIKLERRFNLPMAIFMAEEMLEVTQRQGDLKREASTYRHLSRYHGALGNKQLSFSNTENALRLLEQLGDKPAILNAKMTLLEHSLGFRKLEDVLPEMEALLIEAQRNNDPQNAKFLHIRLLLYSQSLEMYDKMENHIAALEKIPVSTPMKPNDYGNAIHAVMGRADLNMVRKNFAEAERFYQKTLRLCEEEPSRWLEINVLQNLSDLEWQRGNATASKSYLEKALNKAEQLNLDELLASTFERKSNIAEAEGRFAEALGFTKKRLYHDEKFKARGAGFNVENYYLQKEKERLATEQKNNELELNIEKARNRNTLLVTALVVLLALGLFLGLRKQRKDKQFLSTQNALIQQQAEKLKDLDTAKSRFFANISHELRTPLTLVLSPITSLLKENQLTERQTRLIQTAHQSGKELQQLVNEILDLQKLEVGKMELNERPTTLAPFFERYAAQFQSLADRKQIDFSIETAIDNGLSASIDQEKCRQILYNLLSNAFKFTPPNGKIKVKIGKEDEKIGMYAGDGSPLIPPNTSSFVISVSDSGLGIHPEDLPHVFDHFFQTSRPDKPAEGGTGIGLALCHEYAKLFGGTITAESTLGKGTVLRIAFPVKLVDSPSSEVGSLELDGLPVAASNSLVNKPTPQVAAETQKPTILVVEDNHALQDYIRLILEEKYNVVTAENGRVALDRLLPGANCQLILSDLMMPVMDGYQLLEKLKSGDATRHIPVIMLTARAEAKDRLKALRIGVDDYLTKPFDEEELLVRIENLLANSRNRHTTIVSNKPDTNLPVTEDAAAVGPFFSEPDRVWLESFEAYVQKNIANELLNIPFLASEFAMSESTLLRQLKRLTGLSSVQYLQEVRLHKARHLLENRSYDSIAKVADKVGYSDLRSFSRSFKQRFGKSPSDFLSA